MVHELAVTDIFLAAGGVDARNPKLSKGTFFVFSVSVSMPQGLFHLLDDHPPAVFFVGVIPLGQTEKLFLALSGGDSGFYPHILRIGQILSYGFAVRFVELAPLPQMATAFGGHAN